MISGIDAIPDEIRFFTKYISPAFIGGDLAKEALLSAVLGGTEFHHPFLGKIHPAIHILILGETASGNSLLLSNFEHFKLVNRYCLINPLCPLTPEIIRDESGSRVRLAGIFAQTPQGVLCIDDLNNATTADIQAYEHVIRAHECRARFRGSWVVSPVDCSTIAAIRPQLGRFQKKTSLSFNVSLASSFFALFDLVIILEDRSDKEFIDELCLRKENAKLYPDLEAKFRPEPLSYGKDCRDLALHVKYCRSRTPLFTPEVISFITTRSRILGVRNTGHPQHKIMEQVASIYKIAAALAKLHDGKEVTIEDARYALQLHNNCVQKIVETFN